VQPANRSCRQPEDAGRRYRASDLSRTFLQDDHQKASKRSPASQIAEWRVLVQDFRAFGEAHYGTFCVTGDTALIRY
jgi:hypothetical protein